MALVGESGGERDFAERRFGRGNLPVGVLDAQPPNVFADRAAEFSAKNARQVNGMNARDARHVFDRERTGKIIVQKISGSRKPARNGLFVPVRPAARGFRQNFQNQAFDRERRKSVRTLKFLTDPPSEMIDVFGLKARGLIQNRAVFADRGKTSKIELDA